MSRKPSKPETRIEDYLDVMTGGNAALPQPILRIEFYYAFLAGMAVELPQPILDEEKLLARICGMEVEAPTYIPGISPRLYAYMAKKGGQDVQVPDPILRLECYWYDYSAGAAPSVQEYTGAVPVTFVADGTPLLDYIISGNTVQSGTPTPDNPVMPQGTGERTGNLLEYYVDGIIGSDGTISASQSYQTYFAQVQGGETYTMGSNIDVYGFFSSKPAMGSVTNDGTRHFYSGTVGGVITIPEGTTWLGCRVRYSQSAMLNTGSTPLPYEPYGYKIPISSANTTTPVYLGEVQTTRRIGKIDLGTLDWSKTSGGNFSSNSTIDGMKTIPNYQRGNALSDMFTETTGDLVSNTPYSFSSCLNNQRKPYINGAGFEGLTAAEFKQAMSGVYMYYVLATEETGIVNEPLMRIGDYADTLSYAQAGAQIPTANGSTTLDVETTVKPSEVYIKYRGEAVATLSTLSAQVSSPEANEEVNPEETEETENER